jgi:hypothetical protein
MFAAISKRSHVVFVAALTVVLPSFGRLPTCPGDEVEAAPATQGSSASSDRAAALAAELTSPRWWLRAAAEHAANIEPQAEAGPFPPKRPPRTYILCKILRAQVDAGDSEGALAAAKRHAPQLLPFVAFVQVRVGDTNGALATAGQITDAKQKQKAFHKIAVELICARKLADAQRVLEDRRADDLTAGLYERLAKAQAEDGNTAAAQASIKAIRDAPAGDGLNDVRCADAYVALAAAQARAGDRKAYRESLAAARQLTKDFRPPYEGNILVRIARTQADAGDYKAATATLNMMDRKERARRRDLVLTARVKRGDVSPAQAMASVSGYSPVYEAAMEVQLAAKDHKAAAQTFKLANKGRNFQFSYFLPSNIPIRIIDGFLAAGDVDGAAGFVEEMVDPVMRARLYGYLAARRAKAGDRSGYQIFVARALAGAIQLVEPPPMLSITLTRKSDVLGMLAETQAGVDDFEGAKKTVAHIDAPEDRRQYEVELRARELAADGLLEEARTWVASLPDAEDRALACRAVATQLMPTSKHP